MWKEVKYVIFIVVISSFLFFTVKYYFSDENVNIINVGPGSGDEGHKSNEKLLNSDLIDYYSILNNFLKKLK